MKKACILLLHGSRSPREGEIEAVLNGFEHDTKTFVAYLEMQEPQVETCVASCAGLDVDEVHILPLFVLEGRHVRVDIPQRIDALNEAYPHILFKLHPHLGQWVQFKDLLNSMLTSL